MKARIFQHGNKEKMKDVVRKDLETAQCDAIRLLPAIVTFSHAFRLHRHKWFLYPLETHQSVHICKTSTRVGKIEKRASVEITESFLGGNIGRTTMGNFHRKIAHRGYGL